MVLHGPSTNASASNSGSGSDTKSLELAVQRLDLDGLTERKCGNVDGLAELRISRLMRMVLQDAHTRFIFEA